MALKEVSDCSGRRYALSATLGLALPLCLAATTQAASPDAAVLRLAQASPGADADTVRARDKELEAARTEQQKSVEAESRLKREIEAIGNSRRELNQQLIDTASRVQGGEARLNAIEERLQSLDENERNIRKSLTARQGVIAEVLAALQRIGRRPPPALLVRPEDALQSVRSAILLGAVVPELRGEAEALSSDLVELAQVRKDIVGDRERLQREVVSSTEQRQRMGLLIGERQKRQAEVETALDAEQQRAAQLVRQVDNLKELIAKLDQGRTPPTPSAGSPGDGVSDLRTRLAALKDPGRLAPAVAFSAAKGLLPLPVNGIKVRDYGAPDGLGGVLKGITVATRAGAQVTAPCDGTVMYSGPFRSYGQLLILNAGGGYHVLLAGMERISVSLGQFVLTGEPVALMGGGSRVATALSTGSSQPVLYVEFRKDGTPIDPSPWWASEGEKVRG
jgi:septal ring factor EnvC (AmiA/AmiB activator)